MKNRLSRIGFFVFYAAALTISGWFLVLKLGTVAEEQEAQRLTALDAIRGELAQSIQSAQTFVELMQTAMEDEMAVRPSNAPPSRLLAAIIENDDGSYHLDTLPSGIGKLEVGNLTGLGGLKNRDPDFLTEVESALSLRAIFSQVLSELPNVPWTYYISARRFEHVFPWQASSDFTYEDKDLDQEYYVKGAPGLNPNRLSYVTEVYEDDGGKGLMITLGRPVYSSNRFLGVVALDFTLSYIDDVLSKFPKSEGEVYLVGADRRVIGYSNRGGSDEQAPLPDHIGASGLLAPDRVGSRAETAISGAAVLAVQGVEALPFALVTTTPIRHVYAQTARGAVLEIAIFTGVLLLLLFIEWRRRIAGRLLEQSMALSRANEALAKAKEEAEEATKAKSSFLAMMSHEIRTPMNGVMSMAEMLDQTELSDDQRSMSSVIRSSAGALLTIINDILDFSKIEAGKLDIEATVFSLVDLAESAGELVCQRAEDKGIGLSIVIDAQAPEMVVGDPTRIRQVLINLLGNGVKFTEHGGVTLRVAALPSGVIRFEVVDTGIGLTSEQQGRLFKAFEQADVSTSRKYGGTGLGLSISQRLCELMHGRIGVLSEAGKGSTFWFELPLQPADVAISNAVNVADARVIAVGLEGPTRDSFDAILAALGVTSCVHLHYEDDVVGGALGGNSVVFIATQGADSHASLAIGHEIVAQAAANAHAIPVVLVSSRGLASTLTESDRAGFFAAVTLPLRRGRLRQVIAATLGRGSLTEKAVSNTDQNYEPPPLDEARAARAVILVAEDNVTNQVVVRRMLGKLGYALEIADNGRAALEKYQPAEHGLLLTDFHMPEMDGFELTAEIRRREKDSGMRLPIIALTADALPGTEQRCLESGMDGYLTKPIDSKLLAAALEKWLPDAVPLRRTAKPQARKTHGRAIEIDPHVFDSKRLTESFGSFDAEAKAFLANFVVDARGMAKAVVTAMDAGDWTEARHHAHALKGAALSLGAVRLGELAGEVQDYLDQGDPETALLFVGGLETTVQELAQAVTPFTDRA